MISLQQQIKAVERAGWDSLCDIGRVVVFSKKLECLLRHLLAAYAAEHPDYLLDVQNTIPQNTTDYSKLVHQYKRTLDQNVRLDLTVASDTSLQIAIHKACRAICKTFANIASKKVSHHQAVIWRNASAFIDITDDSTKDEIRQVFNTQSTARREEISRYVVVPVIIYVLRDGGTCASKDLKHMIMFNLLSDFPLTLGNLCYEFKNLPYADHTNFPPRRANEIGKALSSVNKLRNKLIHFSDSKRTKLTSVERQALKNDFTTIVKCDAFFELIFFAHNKRKFQAEYEDVITATEWKAVIDEYLKRLEENGNLKETEERDKAQIKAERDMLEEQLQTIRTQLQKEGNKYGKLRIEFNELVVTIATRDREKVDLIQQIKELDEIYVDQAEYYAEAMYDQSCFRDAIVERLEEESQGHQQQLKLVKAQRDSERIRHMEEMQRIREVNESNTQLLEELRLNQADLEAKLTDETTKYNDQMVLTKAAVAEKNAALAEKDEFKRQNMELKAKLV